MNTISFIFCFININIFYNKYEADFSTCSWTNMTASAQNWTKPYLKFRIYLYHFFIINSNIKRYTITLSTDTIHQTKHYIFFLQKQKQKIHSSSRRLSDNPPSRGMSIAKGVKYPFNIKQYSFNMYIRYTTLKI